MKIFVNDIIKTLDETETILYNNNEVINMNELWKGIVITGVSVAVHVRPNSGKHIHKNRTNHGLVINDADSIKDYCFDDGRVMRTKGKSLFYLPKGSSYHVETLRAGGCYAINFDADITDEPFCLSLRNADSLMQNFKAASEAWKRNDGARGVIAMRALYDAVCEADKELGRQYVSGEQGRLIAPAIEVLDRRFSEGDVSVSHLSALCGISEVYFRRLFLNCFGVSPKEYMIRKRIEYAKDLLRSGNFSVSEVAALCGYAEPCHFSREFSRRVGVSPSQYM